MFGWLNNKFKNTMLKNINLIEKVNNNVIQLVNQINETFKKIDIRLESLEKEVEELWSKQNDK